MTRKKDWNQTLQESNDNYSSAYDFNGDNLIYLGKFKLDLRSGITPKAEQIWQIKKFTYDGNDNITEIQFPNGDDDFQFVWNDRVSYNYF